MERIITIICNVILFLLLLCNVNHYADMVLGISSIVLICLFLFYLIRYRKKYIDKSTIITHIICLILQIILICVLGKLDIWKVSSGFMGLGAGPLGVFFYFVVHIAVIALVVVTNVIKCVINRIKK